MPLYRMKARGLRLPRIGTIRKGEQVPVIDKETKKPKLNKNNEAVMRPIEREYWVIHVDAADDENTLQNIYGAYGTEQITSLNVYLLYPDAEQNWSAWMEAYTASQLVARSDERTILTLNDTTNGQEIIKNGKVIALPKDPNSQAGQLVAGLGIGDELPYDENMIVALSATSNEPIRFKAVGRLSVVVQELRRPDRWFTVLTGSYWYDIPYIETAIQKVKEIARYSNRPANTIPLILKRVPVETSYTDDKGKKHRKTMHCTQLEVRDDVIAGLMKAYEETPFVFQLQAGPKVIPPDNMEIEQIDAEAFDEADEPTVGPEWEPELVESNQVELEIQPDSKAVSRPPDVPVITPKFLVDSEIARNIEEAEQLIRLLLLANAPVDKGKKRISLYLKWRELNPRKDDVTRQFCAEKAINGEMPPSNENPF